jgi:hypothetical protein
MNQPGQINLFRLKTAIFSLLFRRYLCFLARYPIFDYPLSIAYITAGL